VPNRPLFHHHAPDRRRGGGPLGQAVASLLIAVLLTPTGANALPTGELTREHVMINSDAPTVKRVVWTSETIRALREQRDYQALLAVVFADYASGVPKYADGARFAADLKRLQSAVRIPATATADPDLNPVVMRALLEELRPLDIIDRASLNGMIKELDRVPAGLTEEDGLLPLTTTGTKADFSRFLQHYVGTAFDRRASAAITAVLGRKIGNVAFPNLAATSQTLIAGAQLPDDVKRTLNALAAGTAVDAGSIQNEASAALNNAKARFDQTRALLTTIAANQDIEHLADVSNLAQKAFAIASSSPSANEVFDTLTGLASALPLPPAVATTIRDVSAVGNAIETTVSTISEVSSSLATLSSIGSLGLDFLATGGIGALAGSLGSIFGGFSSGPSNADVLAAVQQVSQEVRQLHKDMDQRFDRVDAALSTLQKTVDADFASVDDKLAKLQGDTRELLSATGALQNDLIQQSVAIDRLSNNEIAAWGKLKIDELHLKVVSLSDALREADKGSGAISSDCKTAAFNLCNFKDLALYLRVMAKTSAAEFPLNGFQAGSEAFDYGSIVARLTDSNADRAARFKLNYLLATAQGSARLSSLLPTPLNLRDPQASPYVNERAWAIAANGLAAMVERWPTAAGEIPLTDYDAIVTNGRDLETLIAALGQPNGSAINGVFDDVLHQYGKALGDFYDAEQQALSGEVNALGPSLGSPSQAATAALASGLHPTGGPTVAYLPPSVSLGSGCGGESAGGDIADSAKITPAMYVNSAESIALALRKMSLHGCVGNDGSTSRNVQEQHDGWHLKYGDRDVGPVCVGSSSVELVTFNVIGVVWATLGSDPDDFAHRYHVATAHGHGPETEWAMTANGSNFWWSGYNPGPGFNSLGPDCARIYNGSNRVAGLTDLGTYYRNDWPQIVASFGAFQGEPWITWNGIEQHSAVELVGQAQQATQPALDAIYAALAADTLAVLRGADQPHLSGDVVAKINTAARELDATQAMLRTLTLASFSQTASRDDVLHGLLFGTEEIPNRADLAQRVTNDVQGGIAPRDVVADIVTFGQRRVDLLSGRLAMVADAVARTRRSEGHTVLELTLARLDRDRALVQAASGGAQLSVPIASRSTSAAAQAAGAPRSAVQWQSKAVQRTRTTTLLRATGERRPNYSAPQPVVKPKPTVTAAPVKR
jgi:hypothetical protein